MQADAARLRRHVAELSRAPRPAESRELDQARGYVTDHLEEAGWSVVPHPFEGRTDEGMLLQGINLIARPSAGSGCGHSGAKPAAPSAGQSQPSSPTTRPRLCVGAHLDTRPETPGADDNASAVAALLEIARLLPNAWPHEPAFELELVAFDLEEWGMLGGAEHVRLTRANSIDLRGMVSLEMLGYCDHRPHSQMLPASLEGLYPHTGNFIAIIGNQNSSQLLNSFRTGMQQAAGLAVESLAVPANGESLPAARLSDHSPFWDAGYAALMITDTSFLRNPHYHLPSDTVDTLDMQFLERVACGCTEAVRRIIALGV